PDVVARVRENMPAPAELDARTSLFAVLSDPTRLRLLSALKQEELCVCDLSVLARVGESTVSHQLRLVRTHGFVSFRREGRMAYYARADPGLRPLLDGTVPVWRSGSRSAPACNTAPVNGATPSGAMKAPGPTALKSLEEQLRLE